MRLFISVTYHLSIARSTLYHLVVLSGASWGRKRKKGMRRMEAKYQDKFTRYVQRMEAYVKGYIVAPDGKKFVRVFLDESYIHTTHAGNFTWYWDTPEVNAPTGQGQRLCFVTAIVEGHGVLRLPHFQNPDPHMYKWSKDSISLFEGKSRGDNHQSMQGDVFKLWLERQLFPALKHAGIDHAVLIMDNAP